jgi:hypothetical protein
MARIHISNPHPNGNGAATATILRDSSRVTRLMI